MPRRRSEERERYWREVFEAQRLSGQSIRAYCQGQGISQVSYYYWRRQLFREPTDSSAMSPATGTSPRPPFVPLRIQSLLVSNDMIELVHPLGHVLRIPASFDSDSLVRILQVLHPKGS